MSESTRLTVVDAMKNDLVLERIFEFCDVPTLKNIRLTSPQWRDLSLKTWRNKSMIQLAPSSVEMTGVKLCKDFLFLINSSDQDHDPLLLRQHPFKRYCVTVMDYKRHHRQHFEEQKRIAAAVSIGQPRHLKIRWGPGDRTGLHELLSIYFSSESIQSLEVSRETFTDDSSDSDSSESEDGENEEEHVRVRARVEREPAEPLKCSNLKRLKLHTNDVNPNPRVSAQTSLSPYLLKLFPKLEALSLSYGSEKSNIAIEYQRCLMDRFMILTLMNHMRKTGGESVFPLKELEMIDFQCTKPSGFNPIEKMITDLLLECKFPLRRLSIHVGTTAIDGGGDILIMPVLECCKDTIQYLRASVDYNGVFIKACENWSEGEEMNSPFTLKPLEAQSQNVRLEALKELYLLNGLFWGMFLLAHLQLPAMEKLTLDYDKKLNNEDEVKILNKLGHVVMLVPPERVFERLETFQLLDNSMIPEGLVMRQFGRMMPNLAHLTIPLDKIGFMMVCHLFKGLRTLEVLAGQGDYEELDDEYLTGLTKEEARRGDEEGRRPNITHLKHLTELRISCERQLRREDVKFTEHSVIHGLLHVPRLYYLSIAFKELSEGIKEKLVKHVKGTVDIQQKPEGGPNPLKLSIFSEDEYEALQKGEMTDEMAKSFL